MNVIYADRLLLLNFMIDYLLCLVTGRISGLVLRRRRYALAALFGAAYALLTLLPGWRRLAGPAGQLASAALMGLIAFGGERRCLRCLLRFLAVSAALGGAVWAVSLAGGRPALDSRVLVLSFALCYGGVSLLYRARGRVDDLPRAEVRLRLAGRECRFMALLDTGNRLADPLSGSPVMLACPRVLAPLFPGADLSAEPVDLLRAPALVGRFRLVPYSAVGVRGLLPVFRPEGVSVAGRERSDLLVAVSPSAAGDGFDAIV